MQPVGDPGPGHQHEALAAVRAQLRVLLRRPVPGRGAGGRDRRRHPGRAGSAPRSSTTRPTTRRPTGCGSTPRSTSGRCARSTCPRSSGSSRPASRGRSCAPTTRSTGCRRRRTPWLLTTVLREEFGFEGLVVSDWGAVYHRVPGAAGRARPGDAAGPAAAARRRSSRPCGPGSCRARCSTPGPAPSWSWSSKGMAVLDLDEDVRRRRPPRGWRGQRPAESVVLLKNDDAILPLAPTQPDRGDRRVRPDPAVPGCRAAPRSTRRRSTNAARRAAGGLRRGARSRPGYGIGDTAADEALRAEAVGVAGRPRRPW